MKRSMKTACLILAVSTVLSAQTTNSLQGIFQRLVQNFGTPAQPKPEEIRNVEEKIAELSPADIRSALPSVKVALQDRHEKVQATASSALFSISLRSDSADLLNPYIDDIGQLFNSPSRRVTGYAALIVLNLRPAPPPEVVRLMLASLNQANPAEAQISAVAALVRLAPENPDVVAAVLKFLSRPLDVDTRIAALNAIHTSRVNDPGVQDAVIKALNDPHPGVKVAAIGTLDRMGPEAVGKAKSRLQTFTKEPNEPVRVRAAAQDALKEIKTSP